MFEFRTQATMKPYNAEGFILDSFIVKNFTSDAKTIEEATEEYIEFVNDKTPAHISRNASKHAKPLYKKGSRRKGYLFTASINFCVLGERKPVRQYVNLWTMIRKTKNAF